MVDSETLPETDTVTLPEPIGTVALQVDDVLKTVVNNLEKGNNSDLGRVRMCRKSHVGQFTHICSGDEPALSFSRTNSNAVISWPVLEDRNSKWSMSCMPSAFTVYSAQR
jgi:hypothetical protein